MVLSTRDHIQDVSRKMVSGGAASAFAKTCTAPFDRVKILLQTKHAVEASSSHRPYQGILSTLKRLPREQGFLSLWRGNPTNCVRIVPTYALRFTLLPYFQKLVSDGNMALTLRQQMIAGGMAGGATMLITFPLDVIRTRQAAEVRTDEARKPRSMVSTAKLTVANEGWRGLYKGMRVSLLEITPYMAISLGGYEYLKTHIHSFSVSEQGEGSSWMYLWSRLGAGWISGLGASLTMFPVDTVKRQMMLDGSQLTGGTSRFQGSIWRCALASYRKAGLRGYYRGYLVVALTSGPSSAITYCTNDLIRHFLEHGDFRWHVTAAHKQ